MSDPAYWPATLFFPFDSDDWKELHRIVADPTVPLLAREQIQTLLDGLQARAEPLFTMVVWSREDIHNAAAMLAGDEDVFYGEDLAPDRKVITDEEADSVIGDVRGALEDAMTSHGWDVIEFYVSLLGRKPPLPNPDTS